MKIRSMTPFSRSRWIPLLALILGLSFAVFQRYQGFDSNLVAPTLFDAFHPPRRFVLGLLASVLVPLLLYFWLSLLPTKARINREVGPVLLGLPGKRTRISWHLLVLAFLAVVPVFAGGLPEGFWPFFLDFSSNTPKLKWTTIVFSTFVLDYLFLLIARGTDRRWFNHQSVVSAVTLACIVYYKLVLTGILAVSKTGVVRVSTNDLTASFMGVSLLLAGTTALIAVALDLFWKLLQNRRDRGFALATEIHSHIAWVFVLQMIVIALLLVFVAGGVWSANLKKVEERDGLSRVESRDTNWLNSSRFSKGAARLMIGNIASGSNEYDDTDVFLLSNGFWAGLFYLQIIPPILILAGFLIVVLDRYRSGEVAAGGTLATFHKAKMILEDIAAENPIPFLAGLCLNGLATALPALLILVCDIQQTFTSPKGILSVVAINGWLSTLALWLSPLVAGLLKIRSRFSNMYVEKMRRLLLQNRGHTVVVGCGDMGRRLIARLVLESMVEEPASILLGNGSAALVARGIVVVDRQSELFDGGVEGDDKGLRFLRVRIPKTSRPLDYSEILVPGVARDIRALETQQTVGMDQAGIVIGVPRNVETSVTLFDSMEAAQGRVRGILCVESSFNLAYNLYRTIRHQLPIFFLHPSYLRGKNTAGLLFSAIVKWRNAHDGEEPVIMVVGKGPQVVYIIDNLLKCYPHLAQSNQGDLLTRPLIAVATDDEFTVRHGWYPGRRASDQAPAPFEAQPGNGQQAVKANGLTKSILGEGLPPRLREVMGLAQMAGLKPKIGRITALCGRKTEMCSLPSLEVLLFSLDAKDIQTLEKAVEVAAPDILVISHLDPVEQLRVVRNINTVVQRLLSKEGSLSEPPILLVGAETGAGSRSQNIGDAVSRYMNLQCLQADLLPAVGKLDEGGPNTASRDGSQPSEPSRAWRMLYPKPNGPRAWRRPFGRQYRRYSGRPFGEHRLHAKSPPPRGRGAIRNQRLRALQTRMPRRDRKTD